MRSKWISLFPTWPPRRFSGRGRGSGRHLKSRIRNVDVSFHLFDRYRALLVRTTFRTAGDGKREEDSIYLLVGAEFGLAFLHRATDELLALRADFNVGIGIEVVVDDVAVLQRDLQAVDVIPIHCVMSEILDSVPLLFVVDERTIEVGIFNDVAQIVFAKHLGIAPALEGRYLPANFSVVSLDLRHALNRKHLADVGRSLRLLRDLRGKATLLEFS